MSKQAELEADFRAALRSDRTVMLGLEAGAPHKMRPMTALQEVDADRAPIWFFTASDTGLEREMAAGDAAAFTFASKGHDLFAHVHGRLTQSHDRAMIDRLWNPWVATWYEHGKDDPKLVLLRFDADEAVIWRDASSLLAGLRVLLGADPRTDYRDDVVKVTLS